MYKTLGHVVLFVLPWFLFLSVTATAQIKKPSSSQSPTSEKPEAGKAPARLPLQSVTLVTPEQAARKVAEEASTKTRNHKTAPGISNLAGPGQGTEGAVLEFRPADSSQLADSAAAAAHAKGRKNSVLKNIHGSAYGATASGAGRASGEGGSVGADSGNGKLNIYLEGEHAHTGTPTPH